jgi:hypothetical protein
MTVLVSEFAKRFRLGQVEEKRQLLRMAQPHPPGIFDLQIDEEPVDVTWQAYHTTMTLLLGSNGRTEAWPVSREEFERTLAPSIAP